MPVRDITTHLMLPLKSVGFRRKGRIWNREFGDLVDVIDVQIFPSQTQVAVNAGVIDKTVRSFLWDGQLPDFMDSAYATVRTRAGYLKDRRDAVWDTDDPNAGPEIWSEIRTSLLPFLERMHSRAEMRDWLIDEKVEIKRYPPPIVYLAVLHYLTGDQERACGIISNMLQTLEGRPWHDKVATVARKLGYFSG